MILSIRLPEGWRDATADCPGCPLTCIRETSEDSGVFQVSWAEYTGGKRPDPTAEILREMCLEFGEKNAMGEPLESGSGSCEFGLFGTASFSCEETPRIQVWTISDGKHFIRATHICCGKIDPDEVEEAGRIAAGLTLRER